MKINMMKFGTKLNCSVRDVMEKRPAFLSRHIKDVDVAQVTREADEFLTYLVLYQMLHEVKYAMNKIIF